MVPILLIDGNNLGHALGYIDKATGRYDSGRLLACLDDVARDLAKLGQETRIVLFLDDVSAAERLGGWHVQVAPVPAGDADAAIRAYLQAHSDQPQTLISGDRALCGDAVMWGVVCLPPRAFISRYLLPARESGFAKQQSDSETNGARASSSVGDSAETRAKTQTSPHLPYINQGRAERQLQIKTLERASAALRGRPRPHPEVFRLDLRRWDDPVELALYLAEHHLCPEHSELTVPQEMMAAIRGHCCRQPRYFTSGRVINRVFRLFLCRPEHTLSLDDLTRLAKTRRRKIRAAINHQGGPLGIEMA